MIARRLLSLKATGKGMILPHDNPDPDSMAAAWGVAYFLNKALKLSFDIVYCGLIGRAENRAMVRELEVPLKQCDRKTFDRYATIIMVDCQPHTGNSSLPPDVIPDIVIDHHPLRESTRVKQWAHIDEEMGATSTIIASTLNQHGLVPPKNLATALFYAIRSETKDLGWEGTQKDYESYLSLLPRVDFPALYKIEHPKLSPEYYAVLKEAINRSRIYRYLVVCPLHEVPYPELPAEIADFLIFRKGVDMALVMGMHDRDLYLSMRSFHRRLDSAAVMQDILAGLGTGGGHEIMAGGKVTGVSMDEARELGKTIVQRLLKRMSLSRIRPRKLYAPD